MSPPRIGNGNLMVTDSHRCLPLDKEPRDLRGIAALKTSEFVGQHAVEGIGNHGHDDVEVNLHENGGGKAVEAEKLHRLGDDVFHPPPAGIVPDQPLYRGVDVIRDEKGGLLTAVSSNNDLAQLPFIVLKADQGLIHQRVGISSLCVGMVMRFHGPRSSR